MGSIAIVLSTSGPPDLDAVRRMLAAAPHRGPETDVRVVGCVALGVCNQADHIDSTAATAGAYTGVFAGTLDNAKELACTLADAGHVPASTNPADVMTSAFQAFGPDAPNRFRGAFAGVVTDGRQVWCFRDHLGFAPLFYARRPAGFSAATEVKQVIAGSGMSREPDLGVLERIFYGRLEKRSPSAFKGVERLPHATTVTVSGEGALTFRDYWHPGRVLETARFRSDAEVQERFDEVFGLAVARSLTGEDLVSLSGGVDSPAVAGFAAPLYRERTGQPLPALSLVFPDHPAVDERPYIETVTGALGMDLHTMVSGVKILQDLEQWCAVLDGPVPSVSAPQMLEFYREVRRLGRRNILTGDITEVVIDLGSHTPGHLFTRGRWRALARLMETQRQQGNSLRRRSTWKKFASQILGPLVPGSVANWYLVARQRDFARRIPDWLDARTVREVPFRNDLVPSGWRRWTALQTMPVEGCPITMEGVEIVTALAGVTVHRPFGDIDVWEFFLSLPAEIKYPDLRSKTLLRRLMRGRVPDPILDRRDKTVFDDHVMSQVDYAILKRFLLKPDHRVRGVDYERLAVRLDRQDLTLIDWLWMNDLVRIHAFLKQWA